MHRVKDTLPGGRAPVRRVGGRVGGVIEVRPVGIPAHHQQVRIVGERADGTSIQPVVRTGRRVT